MATLPKQFQMYGLVRDGATGKPRVDDPAKLNPVHLSMMSIDERRELNLWPHHWARDAQGWKRVEKVGPDEFTATEAIVGMGQLIELGDEPNKIRLAETPKRPDYPQGTTFTCKTEVVT